MDKQEIASLHDVIR